MALTRRGRLATSLTVVAVAGGVVFGVSALAGRAKPAASGGPSSGGSPSSSPSPTPPPVCPLTGVTLTQGAVPNRPALAVKVENLPEARPQTGLDSADIVYEE